VNRGDPARGLEVELTGDAIGHGLLEIPAIRITWRKKGVRKVHSGDDFENATAPAEPRFAGDRSVLVARFPDVELWSAPPPAGPGDRKAWEVDLAATIQVGLEGAAKGPGRGALAMRLAPIANREAGAVTHVTLFDVALAPRAPLKGEALDRAARPARALETPETLFAWIVLGADRATSARVAGDVMEAWARAIAPERKGRFTTMLMAGGRPEQGALDAAELPHGEAWRRLRGALATCDGLSLALPAAAAPPLRSPLGDLAALLGGAQLGGLGALLGGAGRGKLAKLAGAAGGAAKLFQAAAGGVFGSLFGGHGMAFHVALVPIAEEDRAPHLGLWMDVRGASAEAARGAAVRLGDLVDEAMAAGAGIQAILGRWAWQPAFGADCTPYEQACGVHGQCTTLREWCTRYLHGVTDRVWLGPALLARVDRGALSQVATLEDAGAGARVELQEGRALADLERALEPILPTADAWQAAMKARVAKLDPAEMLRRLKEARRRS
jgi:hypothetical protein